MVPAMNGIIELTPVRYPVYECLDRFVCLHRRCIATGQQLTSPN